MASVSRDTPFSSAGPRALSLRAYKPQHASGRRGIVMDKPSCELVGRRGKCTVAHAQRGGGRVGWQRWIRVGAAGGQVGGGSEGLRPGTVVGRRSPRLKGGIGGLDRCGGDWVGEEWARERIGGAEMQLGEGSKGAEDICSCSISGGMR